MQRRIINTATRDPAEFCIIWENFLQSTNSELIPAAAERTLTETRISSSITHTDSVQNTRSGLNPG